MKYSIQTIQEIIQNYVGEDNPIPREVVEEILIEYKNYSVVSNEFLCHLISLSEKANSSFFFED